MIDDFKLMNEESTMGNRQTASAAPTQFAATVDSRFSILRSSITDRRSSMCRLLDTL